MIQTSLFHKTTHDDLSSTSNPQCRVNLASVFRNDITDYEHLSANGIAVILADCMSLLPHVRSESVDLIFADPPYNIGKDFGNKTDKWEHVENYISWCKSWIDECMRVLNDEGTMYFMTATQHMPFLDIYVSEKYNVLCRIVWTYDSSGVQSKKNVWLAV